jgi:hypothetical protein
MIFFIILYKLTIWYTYILYINIPHDIFYSIIGYINLETVKMFLPIHNIPFYNFQ